jgi:hypothetical protein
LIITVPWLRVPGSVLVAVRARPLNDREKAEKSSECLTFQDQKRGDFSNFRGCLIEKNLPKYGIFWLWDFMEIHVWLCKTSTRIHCFFFLVDVLFDPTKY